jgi:prophage regulatory protein
MAQINKLPQVIAQTGLGRSTLYILIKEGSFPSPIRLSHRSVGWLSHEVDDWITQRTEKTREVK